MNFDRAQEIVESTKTIEVLLNGSPVWIEDLDVKNNMARVKPLNGQGGFVEVPVAELIEARFS